MRPRGERTYKTDYTNPAEYVYSFRGLTVVPSTNHRTGFYELANQSPAFGPQ